MNIIECISCDGYGWYEDDDDQIEDCAWCGGIGYTYRDEAGVDHRIPQSDYEKMASVLEQLEAERLRRLGYTGKAKPRSE